MNKPIQRPDITPKEEARIKMGKTLRERLGEEEYWRRVDEIRRREEEAKEKDE